MRDGDLLTAGDLKLFRAGYCLYKIDDTSHPTKKEYILIGSWEPKGEISTLTFHYEGHQIHFPPVPPTINEIEEESLWES